MLTTMMMTTNQCQVYHYHHNDSPTCISSKMIMCCAINAHVNSGYSLWSLLVVCLCIFLGIINPILNAITNNSNKRKKSIKNSHTWNIDPKTNRTKTMIINLFTAAAATSIHINQWKKTTTTLSWAFYDQRKKPHPKRIIIN